MTLPDLESLTSTDERLRQVPTDREAFAAASPDGSARDVDRTADAIPVPQIALFLRESTGDPALIASAPRTMPDDPADQPLGNAL